MVAQSSPAPCRGEILKPRSDLVPTNLAQIVHFVAVFLDAFGEALEPGDLILSGSFCPVAVPLGPGNEAHAEFGPLGEVSVKVATQQ